MKSKQQETEMLTKEKDYFSSREAAELLDVAVSTVQLWTNNGLLRAWTTGGGHRRIARSSVEEILSQKRAVSDDQSLNEALSVVVVEDDAQLLRLYEKQLASLQINTHIVTANDGYEGLVKVGHELPDVIITDLMMPNINGFQMIKALKDMPELENSLIIVISGLTKDEISSRGGLPEGVHPFTKPVDFENIKTLLSQKAELKVAQRAW